MMVRKRPVALAEQPSPYDPEPLEQPRRDERASAITAVVHDAHGAPQTADALGNVVDIAIDDRLGANRAGT